MCYYIIGDLKMENVDIKRLLKTLLSKKSIAIGIITILFTLALGYIYSFYFVVPKYKASTTIVLVKADTQNGNNNSDTITQSDITLNQKLVGTYSEIMKSDRVLSTVIDNLHLEISEQELSKEISVSAIDDTEILNVTVKDTHPKQAAKITNELVSVFAKEVMDIYNINNVSIIDEAKIPVEPYNINHTKDLGIAFGIGVLLYAGIVIMMYMFDTTIKIEEDVEEFIGLNTLISLPVYNKKEKDKLKLKSEYDEIVVFEDPKSAISENFRTLRTNLMFTQTDKTIKTILVTSSNMAEGKSWVSANLATTFAKSDKRVIIVDADMRKGRQHNIFKLSHKQGLSNCLSISAENREITPNSVSKYIKETRIPNLHVITGGDRPPNPSELLSSQRVAELLDVLRKMYDIVIIDGTPSTIVSDSVILSRVVDTTVIVTASRQTKIEAANKVKKAIESAGGTIAGIVINKMQVRGRKYQSTYYYSDIGGKRDVNKPKGQENTITSVEDILKDLDEEEYLNMQETAKAQVQEGENQESQEEFGKKKTYIRNYYANDSKEMEEKVEAVNQELRALKQAIKNKGVYDTDYINDEIQELKQMLIENLDNKTSNVKLEELKDEVNNLKTFNQKFEKINDAIESLEGIINDTILEDDSDKEIRRLEEKIEKMNYMYQNKITELQEKLTKQDTVESLKLELNNIKKSIEDIKKAEEPIDDCGNVVFINNKEKRRSMQSEPQDSPKYACSILNR